MTKVMYVFIAVALIAGLASVFYTNYAAAPEQAVDRDEVENYEELNDNSDESEGVMCTMDAMECPDGSFVGRSGPSCEFDPCP